MCRSCFFFSFSKKDWNLWVPKKTISVGQLDFDRRSSCRRGHRMQGECLKEWCIIFTSSKTCFINGVRWACIRGSSEVIFSISIRNFGDLKSCSSCIGWYSSLISLCLSCHLRHRGAWYQSSHVTILSLSIDLQSSVRDSRGYLVRSIVFIPGTQLSPKCCLRIWQWNKKQHVVKPTLHCFELVDLPA